MVPRLWFATRGRGGEQDWTDPPPPQAQGAGRTTGSTNTRWFDPTLLPLSCFLTAASFCFLCCSLHHKHRVSVDL